MTRLALRAATPAHIPYVLAWVEDPRTLLLWSGTRFDWPLTEEALHAHITQSTSAARRLLLGITCDGGQPVAYAELIRIRNTNEKRYGRLARIIVDPAQRGRGYGTAFVRLVVDYAFDKLHLNLIDLYVFLSNQGAIACYRNVGFREWDILVQAFRGPNGQAFDLLKMGLRRSDWLLG